MASFPSAKTTERNGEISCSIEETNRIRAALGLGPLRVGPRGPPPPQPPQPSAAPPPAPAATAAAAASGEISLGVAETNALRASLGLAPLRASAARAETFVDLAAAGRAREEAAAAAARLERTRRERAELEAASRQSLGQQLVGSKVSAAEWVAQSRRRAQLVETAKAELSARGGGGAGAPAAAAPRAGIKIAHGAEAFESAAELAGEAMVLTLKDAGLLDEGGTGLAEAEDELVHAALADRERAAEAQARKKKGGAAVGARPVAYAYEMEEEEGGGGGGSAAAPPPALLPQ
jgi:hypothetical protein